MRRVDLQGKAVIPIFRRGDRWGEGIAGQYTGEIHLVGGPEALLFYACHELKFKGRFATEMFRVGRLQRGHEHRIGAGAFALFEAEFEPVVAGRLRIPPVVLVRGDIVVHRAALGGEMGKDRGCCWPLREGKDGRCEEKHLDVVVHRARSNARGRDGCQGRPQRAAKPRCTVRVGVSEDGGLLA